MSAAYLRVASVDGASLWSMDEEHAWAMGKSLAEDGWGPTILRRKADGSVAQVARWRYSESFNREVVPVEWLRCQRPPRRC